MNIANNLLELAILAAIRAGNEVKEIFYTDYAIELKSDQSPITKADKLSHQIITSHLIKTKIPIISEESKILEYSERSYWEYCWLIDPLDGTKEFIQKNGEFTINIALIKNMQPILGVIFSPLSGWLYFASPETGSIKVFVENSKIISETMMLLPNKNIKPNSIRVAISRSHLDNQTETFLFALKQKYPNLETIKSGSAIKLCLVAEGEADIYPRFGKTMEWDVAAGHAIVLYSEANVYEINSFNTLVYNKAKLENPPFIALRNNLLLY